MTEAEAQAIMHAERVRAASTTVAVLVAVAVVALVFRRQVATAVNWLIEQADR